MKAKIFYNPKMVPDSLDDCFSNSPMKPKFFYDAAVNKLGDRIITVGDFQPFGRVEFEKAHTPQYVEAFLNGIKPKCESNGIPWSQSLANSVPYTTSSLYNAIKCAISEPNTVCVAPVSGFHHAMPSKGQGFCTFSGQVIASVMIYEELGSVGAYVDLDAHLGNSIEDARKYVPEINKAVPYGCNVNPIGLDGADYVEDFKNKLVPLRELIITNKINYLVFCHGADSHIQDDTGHGLCNTEQWLECSKIFYEWKRDLDDELGRYVPLTLCLFGGYRKDDYNFVINLHVSDLAICLDTLKLHE